jgi:hypothetical protein
MTNEDILLTDADLFARYGRMNEIDALRSGRETSTGEVLHEVNDSSHSLPS